MNEVSNEKSKKCPKCGGKMEEGYVIATALWWDKEMHKWQAGSELLSKPIGLQTNFPALRCLKCSIVVLDCQKKE